MSNIKTTIYVLGGGFMIRTPDGGRAFYRAMIGGRKTANVLICCFAMQANQWQTGYEKEKDRIESFTDESSLLFQNADLEHFIDQVVWADVIVFRGGSTQDLISRLAKMPGWQTDLHGKTIVGSSAGANMLSSNYLVTDKTPQLAQGLGLLPTIMATHYRSAFIHDGDVEKSRVFWDKVDDLMRSRAGEKDIITLKEGDYRVLRSLI